MKNIVSLKALVLIQWFAIVTTYIWFFSLYPLKQSVPSVEGWLIIAIYVFGGSAGYHYFQLLWCVPKEKKEFWGHAALLFSLFTFCFGILLGGLVFSVIDKWNQFMHISLGIVVIAFVLIMVASEYWIFVEKKRNA